MQAQRAIKCLDEILWNKNTIKKSKFRFMKHQSKASYKYETWQILKTNTDTQPTEMYMMNK